MNNVMTNGFAELSATETEDVNGGFKTGDYKKVIGEKFGKAGGKWYANTFFPKAERFGAKVYDLLH